jgi:uncharacterized membrane protein YwaF
VTWGTFTLQHILSLAAIVGIAVSLYFILKQVSDKIKIKILFAVSLLGVAAVLYDLVRWGRPLEYLPLHLCSLNALIIPVAVLTRNKVAAHLTLAWSLGAALVLVVNTGQAHYLMTSEAFWIFVVCHAVDVTVPALLFATGLVKFNVGKAPAVVGTTIGAYTCVHFINLGINRYFIEKATEIAAYSFKRGGIPQVNYMYSLGDEGNAVFAIFREIIPYDYWHMYLIAPILVGFLFAIHFMLLKKERAAEKRALNKKAEKSSSNE